MLSLFGKMVGIAEPGNYSPAMGQVREQHLVVSSPLPLHFLGQKSSSGVSAVVARPVPTLRGARVSGAHSVGAGRLPLGPERMSDVSFFAPPLSCSRAGGLDGGGAGDPQRAVLAALRRQLRCPLGDANAWSWS